jgi:hypothetical protein
VTGCGSHHPDHPDWLCMSTDADPLHPWCIAQWFPPDGGQPRSESWANPAYQSRAQLQIEREQARGKVEQALLRIGSQPPPSADGASPRGDVDVAALAARLRDFRDEKSRTQPRPSLDPVTTMRDARDHYFARLAGDRMAKLTGAVTLVCPVCLRPDTIHCRPLDTGEAKVLARLRYLTTNFAGRYPGGWVHVQDIGQISRSEGKLRLWGLVEMKRERRADGGKSGFWRLTEKGVEFVENRVAVFKYIVVGAKNQFLWHVEPEVRIQDVIPAFHLNKMLHGESPE